MAIAVQAGEVELAFDFVLLGLARRLGQGQRGGQGEAQDGKENRRAHRGSFWKDVAIVNDPLASCLDLAQELARCSHSVRPPPRSPRLGFAGLSGKIAG